VEVVLGQIVELPRSFPRKKSYLGVREIRSCRLERFPYAVIFACEADEPLVIAIGHARRHPSFGSLEFDETSKAAIRCIPGKLATEAEH
jgi:hypothetical protein